MAYMPLFATMEDDTGLGCVQTRSLRGLVHSIGVWINSEIGDVARLSAQIDKRTGYDLNRHIECEKRLEFWTANGNKRWIKHWKEQLEIIEELKKEEDKRKVGLFLDVGDNQKIRLAINNVRIDKELLDILRKASDMNLIKEILKKHIGSIEGL